MVNRLVIFVFFDKHGILDDYITTCLHTLQKDVGPVLFVVNGSLNLAGQNAIAPFVQEIISRENIGLDAWAYKYALEHIGFARLIQYDEVILMNDTCFGPLYPWKELFDTMAARADLDFWGLTSTSIRLKNIIKNKRTCGRHIDSYFTVFGKNILISPCFEEYWRHLPPLSTYDEAVKKHESMLCEFFTRHGFRWGTYCHINERRDHVFYSPYNLIKEQHCPLIKRRCFTNSDDLSLLLWPCHGKIYETFSYIEEHTNYDTALIWQHILRFAPEQTVLRNIGVKNPFPHALVEQQNLRLTMLPRIRGVGFKKCLCVFQAKLGIVLKSIIKYLLYPYFRKYLQRQRKQEWI